jgi:RNA polymerase sigma-70 factor (ECF subfamily)
MAQPDGHNSETHWIACAQAGDQAAFGHLVQTYQRLVVSVAYRQGLDLEEARDVAQEAFVKAWLALPKYRPEAGSWRAWLCRIAVNLAIDRQRRERPRLSLDEDWPDAARGPAEQAEADLRAQAVRRALAQLPPASRATLVLNEYEGLSYAEIAAALDIPLGTVMSRLHYARQRLRELLVRGGFNAEPVEAEVVGASL